MKNSSTELVDVCDRIDELADQMARVPLDAEVLAPCGVEEPFPHRRLAEHVVVHERQMIRALRAMLEGDAHALVRGERCQRLPKLQQLRQKIFKWLVNHVAAALVPFCF